MRLYLTMCLVSWVALPYLQHLKYLHFDQFMKFQLIAKVSKRGSILGKFTTTFKYGSPPPPATESIQHNILYIKCKCDIDLIKTEIYEYKTFHTPKKSTKCTVSINGMCARIINWSSWGIEVILHICKYEMSWLYE